MKSDGSFRNFIKMAWLTFNVWTYISQPVSLKSQNGRAFCSGNLGMQPNASFEVVIAAEVVKHVSDGKLKLSRISQLRVIVYKSKYDPIFL